MENSKSTTDLMAELAAQDEQLNETSGRKLAPAKNNQKAEANKKVVQDRSKPAAGWGESFTAAWENQSLTSALGEHFQEQEASGAYDYEFLQSDEAARKPMDVDAYLKDNKEIAARLAALPEEYSDRAYSAFNEDELLVILENVEKRQANMELLATNSGASNLAISLVAGIADPAALILEAMTGGLALGAATRMGTAGRAAIATGIATGGTEALVAGQDPMVTNTDIAIATAAGFTLGGLFGAWAGPVRNADYEAAGSAMVRRAKAEEDPSAPRRKETYIDPLGGTGRLTSQRGSRIHPITGKASDHGGDDLAAPIGTPIHATASGTVERIDYNTGANGYAVFLRHRDGTQSVYLHMKGQPPLKKGQVIEQGFQIGQVGTTGRSTGPHLHWEIRDAEGNKLNPSDMIGKQSVEEDIPMDAGPYSMDTDAPDYVAGDDIAAAPMGGTGGLSAAGAESAEYFGGGTLSKYILKPLQTFAGILLADTTPANIRGFAGKLMEGLSRKDGQTRAFTAERTAQDLNRRWQSQYVERTEGHFKEWLKERGGNKLRGMWGNKYLQEFRTEISAAIRGADDPNLSPQARAAANEVRPILADIVRQAKEAGVEGFEDVAESAVYLPRVINNGQMSRIRGEIGDKGIASMVAGALSAKGMDPKIAESIGKFYTHSARNRALGGVDDIFSDISEESIENLRRSITDVKPEDVDAMIEQLRNLKEGAQRQQSKHKNSKYRLDMDENFSTVINGTRYRVTDLWQNDSYALLSRYSRSMSGWIGMSKHAGVKGDGDWQFQMQRIRDESPDSPDLKKQIDNLEHVKTLLTGGSLDPEATSGGAQFLSAVRKANFAAMMGQAGLASFAEFGHLLARHGWVDTLKHVPGFRQILRGARGAELDEAFARELRDLTGVGLNTKRGSGTGGYDDLGYMMESKVYNAVDKILDPAARAVGIVGLLGPVNDGLQMVFQKSASAWFGRAARNGGRKGMKPRELRRLRDDGFDDGVLDQILDNLDRYADYDGDTITSFNINDWDGDVSEEFLSGLNRMTYRAIQENDIGSGAHWMHSSIGKTVMQFRSFIGNALIKQTLHGAKFTDMQTFTAFSYAMFIASLTYVGRTTWNNIGDEEKRKERLTPMRIATAAFNNVGYASLIPAAFDTVAGTLTGEQLFSHGRTTGLDSSLITGNPTVDLLTNRLPKMAETVQIPLRGRGVDQQDFNAFRRSGPFNNVLGVTSLNSLIEAELPKSTRGDAYWE